MKLSKLLSTGKQSATVVLAASFCLFALSACDDPHDVDYYLAEATEHLAAGDLDASVIELKNAVALAPDNAAVRRLLGDVHRQAGDYASAEKEYSRAWELGDRTDDLFTTLLQVQIRLEAYDAVLSATEELGIPDTTDKVRQLALRGAALFGLGRLDEAQAVFIEAHAIEPVPETYFGQARIALVNEDLAAADAHLKEGLARFPDDVELLRLSGERLLADRKFAEAEPMFAELVERQPHHLYAQLGLARARIGLGRFDEVRKLLDELAAQTKGNARVKALRAVVALRTEDYPVAQQDARDVLAVQPNNHIALFANGAASYALGQYEQARTALVRYVSAVPDNGAARQLLGATELQLGQPEKAVATLNAGAADSTDSAYLAVASVAIILSGEVEQGLSYLEQAVLQSPDDAGLRAHLGLTKIALGQTEQGALDLERALELDPEMEEGPGVDKVLRTLILGHLREKRYDEALKAARTLQEKEPEATAGFVLEGMAHMGLEDEAQARNAFNKALEIKPGATDAASNLAMLELRHNRPEEALRLLQQVVEHNPKHYRTLMILAELEGQLGRTEPSKEWLRKAVEAAPGKWEPRILLAERLLLEGRAGEALSVGRPALDAHGDVPAVLNIVGTALVANGQLQEAADAFRHWAEIEPQLGAPTYRLAEALSKQGDREGAIAALEQSIEADPGNPAAKFALAELLLGTGDVERAKEVAAKLKAQAPDNPGVNDLEGRILLRENKPQEAVAMFMAAKENLDVSRINTGLATAQWMAGEQDQAVVTLQEWLARSPDDMTAAGALNSYLVALGRTDEAKASLNDMLARNGDNAYALNGLAWLHWKEGNLDQAAPLAERAYAVAPQNPRVLDTLGMIELSRGETERSVALLKRAADIERDNPQTAYHLALALSTAGSGDEAEAILEKVVSAGEPFPEREEAEKLLNDLRAR